MTAVTRGTTYDNRANLAKRFFDDTVKRYEGTRLGRQELMAEILGDNPDALWSYSQLDALRVKIEGCPSFRRIVVAVDPPASTGDMATGRMPDECGIIVAGLGEDGHGYVLDDATTRGMSPNQWAKRAIETYALWNADAMVVEINQGGNMVKNTIEQVNQRVTHLPVLNIREVRAHEGRRPRARATSGSSLRAARTPWAKSPVFRFRSAAMSGPTCASLHSLISPTSTSATGRATATKPAS
jgi:phage terminase large subunit-like protein